MTENKIDQLASSAANYAMQAAALYLRQVEYTISDYDAVIAVLRRHVKEALPAALDDVREALAAHTTQVAMETFFASMRLAGIAAAKEISGK